MPASYVNFYVANARRRRPDVRVAVRRRGRRAHRRALPWAPGRGHRRARGAVGRRRVSLHHAAAARRGGADEPARRAKRHGRRDPVSRSRDTRAENIARVEKHVREAAARGATRHSSARALRGALLLPRREGRVVRRGAHRVEDDEAVKRLRQVARELGVVVPVSFFERAGQAYYNSVAIIDADGAVLGVYRKSHIPDGPGYEEKFYFRPGDTGLSRVADAVRRHRGRHLLGPVVPRVGARDDAARRRGALLSHRHRQRAARPGPRHARPLAAGDGRSRRVERRAGRRREPRSATSPGRSSTARRSSPTLEVTRRVELGRTDEGAIVATLRPRARSSVLAPRGASSATAAPSSTTSSARPTAGSAARPHGSSDAVEQRGLSLRSRVRTCCSSGKRVPERRPAIRLRPGFPNAPSQLRPSNCPLGLRLLSGRRVRPVRRAAAHPVAAAAEPLPRLLRGLLQPQPRTTARCSRAGG